VEQSRTKGQWLKDQFVALQARHPMIGDVRGLGIMVGLELVRDRASREPAGPETARLVA